MRFHYYRILPSTAQCLRATLIILLISVASSCRQNISKSPAAEAAYNTVLDSANHLFDSGRQSKAVQYLNSVSSRFENLTYNQRATNLTIHYNYYFHIKQDNRKAIYYADQLLELAKKASNQEDHASTYGLAKFYKGDALFRENKYNEAYLNYYQGKIASSQSKKLQNCLLSDYSYHMGMILYKQEHYRMAAGYFRTSFDELGTCEINFRVFYRGQEVLNNVGISYNNINELDSAQLYFDKALDYINNPPKKFIVADSLLSAARGVVYGNKASVFIKRKQLNQAKVLLKQSIAINSQKGFDNNDAVLSELKLVQLYEKQLQVDSMLLVLNNIELQLKTIKNDDAAAEWSRLMASYHQRKNQLPEAITYLRRYNTLKDTINKKMLALKTTDITGQLKRFERDYEFNQLKKTNELKNLYLIVAVVFFIMAVIILLLIYSNGLKSKKILNTMSELNREIHFKNIDLEKTMQKLEMSSQEKDRILRTVAHDLRNPIGGIAALSSTVIEEESCTPDQQTYLSLIKDTAYNSLELINEILEATNTNQDVIQKDWVEINAVITNSVELLRFKAAEKNQEIKLNVLDKPEETLLSREKIWRVVSNLISNAIKFSPVGAEIQVSLIKMGEDIEITVKDHGIGIPEEVKATVFNMFTEAKRPGTLGEKSFGLGLSICRHIIELHGGNIWFESEQQKGTTFHVKLYKVTKTA
ncbi:HAMP domain-containing sensor histidine kinase [Mucilaginibacter galii]|uniref:histidine kinase n=1 Tax=Mucilaginibacter galii TaxID=2005073 RepID=A0A917JA86_9SPHI|nr:HAMP domain-containing sensor histidine kinase [Mucilaginibacter galii]GGI51384.1 histidine kinase [Mucilaginibacter galii]